MITGKKQWISKLLFLILIMSVVALPIMNVSAENIDIQTAAQDEAKNQIESLLTKGFTPYYDILGLETEITRVDENEDSLDIYTLTTMNNVLRAKAVTELPHVQGMLKAVKLNDLKQDSLENTVKAIQANKDIQMEDIQVERAAKLLQFKIRDVEPYIGKPDETNFVFKFTVKKVKDGIDPVTAVLLVENIDKYVPAETIIPESSEEMINNGIEEIMTGINDVRLDKTYIDDKTVNPTLYPYYNRIDARDYANTYTSNATKYCSHGSALQNTSFWNTSTYPAFLGNFCHNDCADYVSQSLAYGGIPKDSTWTRSSANNSWTYAWQNCNGLKKYMYDTKSYWALSDYTNAAAGGVIMYKNSDGSYYHTVMIVKNDTVSRQFSGHTNDRKQYGYGNSSGCEYYILW